MVKRRLDEREAVYLGALLHDIGKFRQRATEERIPHALLSAGVIDMLLQDERVKTIAAYHHKEQLRKSGLTGTLRALAELVCEADSLASGERLEAPEVQQQQALLSIFSHIKLGKETPPMAWQPIGFLYPEGYPIPVTEAISGTELQKQYEAHWKSFVSELQALGGDISPDTLLALLKKYLWCIPSASYRSLPDVSLYEHSRMVAALAICLYDYLVATQGHIEPDVIEDREEKRYLLICGDLTGIQRFIYNVAHKGALKALKGRSFFLQVVLQVMSRELLRRLQLPQACLLYASGGKFFALTPNTDLVRDELLQFRWDMQQMLLERYGDTLGLALGDIVLSGNDIYGRAITERWAEVTERVEQAKRQPFVAAVTKPAFWEPMDPGGRVVTCYATGRYLAHVSELDQKIATGEVVKDEEDRYLSQEQALARKIGERLRRTRALEFIWPEEQAIQDQTYPVLGVADLRMHEAEPRPSDVKGELVWLNMPDRFLPGVPKQGWQFYGGNWTFEGDFDELAEEAQGSKLLGVLRVDVDNLGLIFRDGLGDKATFSRVVQLSTMMDFFFSGYLNKLQSLQWNVVHGVNAEDGESLRDLVQIVYAGGDDLFIVGVWNVLPDVALWIQQEFSRFTARNPYLTLSGGIALFPPKLPLYHAAQMAGHAEEEAKHYKRSITKGYTTVEKSKDAVFFLDAPMSWHDLQEVRRWMVWLFEALEGKKEGKLSRSILWRLYGIHELYLNQGGQKWGKWRWRACYYLTRYKEQYKAYEKDLRRLAAELFMEGQTEVDLVSLIHIPARWTEMLTRKED